MQMSVVINPGCNYMSVMDSFVFVVVRIDSTEITPPVLSAMSEATPVSVEP